MFGNLTCNASAMQAVSVITLTLTMSKIKVSVITLTLHYQTGVNATTYGKLALPEYPFFQIPQFRPGTTFLATKWPCGNKKWPLEDENGSKTLHVTSIKLAVLKEQNARGASKWP